MRHPPLLVRGSGLEQKLIRQAASAMAVDPSAMMFRLFSPGLTGENGVQVVSGAGTRTPVDRAVQIAVNANFVEYDVGLDGAATAQRSANIKAGTGAKWWLWWRGKFSIASVPDTGGGMAGATGGALQLVVGAHGTTSGVNFALFGLSGSINSGVAIDAATHEFSGYRDGSTGYFRIDTTIVTGDARPTTDCSPLFHVQHAAAAARQVELEAFAFAVPIR